MTRIFMEGLEKDWRWVKRHILPLLGLAILIAVPFSWHMWVNPSLQRGPEDIIWDANDARLISTVARLSPHLTASLVITPHASGDDVWYAKELRFYWDGKEIADAKSYSWERSIDPEDLVEEFNLLRRRNGK